MFNWVNIKNQPFAAISDAKLYPCGPDEIEIGGHCVRKYQIVFLIIYL